MYLERERMVLAETEPDPKNIKETLEFVFKNFKKAEPSVQRNFMRQVFEKIVVLNKYKVQVHWRFPEIKKTDSMTACGSGGIGFALGRKLG